MPAQRRPQGQHARGQTHHPLHRVDQLCSGLLLERTLQLLASNIESWEVFVAWACLKYVTPQTHVTVKQSPPGYDCAWREEECHHGGQASVTQHVAWLRRPPACQAVHICSISFWPFKVDFWEAWSLTLSRQFVLKLNENGPILQLHVVQQPHEQACRSHCKRSRIEPCCIDRNPLQADCGLRLAWQLPKHNIAMPRGTMGRGI